MNLDARFWPNVNRTPDQNGCLLWLGSLSYKGYGRTWIHRKMMQAHRLAWLVQHGNIAPGLCVLHRCDNPACVNHEHLFLGTDADNMRDRDQKQRQARGERNGRAKLTPADVHVIRDEHATGAVSQGALAGRFGVARSTIKKILDRKLWAGI